MTEPAHDLSLPMALVMLALVGAVECLWPVTPRDELVPIACRTPHYADVMRGEAEDAPAMAMRSQ